MRNYPKIYSQRDPKWASQRLGTVNGSTIGQYGCYLTCDAMTAGYFHHEITPNALDDIFTNKKYYVSGNLLTDDALTKVFPEIVYQKTYSYKDVPADLNLLRQLAQDDTLAIILCIDFDHDPNDGIQTHFVCVQSYEGNILKIYDPWYGTEDDFALHYGNNPGLTIQKVVVYKGNPVNGTVAVDAAVFPQLVDKSTKYDAFHAAGYTTVDDVIKKVGDLTNANTQFQQDIQKLQGQISDMATAIQKVKDEDLQAVDDSLKAQHERDSAVSDLNFAKKLLGLDPQATPDDMDKAVSILKGRISDLEKELKEQPKPQAEITDPDVKVAFSLITFLKKIFGKGGDTK